MGRQAYEGIEVFAMGTCVYLAVAYAVRSSAGKTPLYLRGDGLEEVHGLGSRRYFLSNDCYARRVNTWALMCTCFAPRLRSHL